MNTDKNDFNLSIQVLDSCFYHLTNKLRGNKKRKKKVMNLDNEGKIKREKKRKERKG